MRVPTGKRGGEVVPLLGGRDRGRDGEERGRGSASRRDEIGGETGRRGGEGVPLLGEARLADEAVREDVQVGSPHGGVQKRIRRAAAPPAPKHRLLEARRSARDAVVVVAKRVARRHCRLDKRLCQRVGGALVPDGQRPTYGEIWGDMGRYGEISCTGRAAAHRSRAPTS